MLIRTCFNFWRGKDNFFGLAIGYHYDLIWVNLKNANGFAIFVHVHANKLQACGCVCHYVLRE